MTCEKIIKVEVEARIARDVADKALAARAVVPGHSVVGIGSAVRRTSP